MHLFKINVLTFNFYVFSVFRTQGFIFRKTVVYAGMVWYGIVCYGIVCFTCIGVGSLVAYLC